MAVPWMVDADLFVPTVYSDSSESVSPAAVALDCPCVANVCVRTLGTGCSWVTLSNGWMTARTRSWIRMLHLSAAQKSTSALQSGAMPSSTKIYFLLLVEMAGLCGFALFRRRRSRVKYSAKLY